MARLDAAGVRLLREAVADPVVVARYRDKIVDVPGERCRFWSAAIAGAGHGRFWFGRGHVIIAHRFAFALQHGVDTLLAAQLLAHGCDNPLCQLVDPGHVRVSTPAKNKAEWLARRRELGVLADPRGPARRARELRDLARLDPALVAADLAAVRARLGVQLLLPLG